MMNLSIIERLKVGRAILSDETLDAISDCDPDFCNTIRTARNRNRLGLHDQYVGWVRDCDRPPDLEFCDGYAVASI